MRRIALTVMLGMVMIRAAAQTPAQKPAFEVVSIRPCKPDEPGGGMRPTPGGERYVANCASLKSLMWVSYWLQSDQVIGGPNWIENERFYIEGVAARPSTITELKAMMQNAITERFKLRFHRETKELDAYVLDIDKIGPK